MFDFVRKHTKIMMALMFLLIIPSFVLFGIDGYNRMSRSDSTVASVDGQDITQAQWDAAHKSEMDRIRASIPGLDAKLLDSPEIRYSTLEQLVRNKVMTVAADQSGLWTSDARLASFLKEDATIASLRKPDGSMDMDRYRQWVAAQGMTPEGFENNIRRNLSIRQVETGLRQSDFAVPTVADVSLKALNEQREIQVARFVPDAYAASVHPADTELSAYYKDHQTEFQAPEQTQIEYVVLDLDAVQKSIAVSDADIKASYEQNVAALSGKEERRASHILIKAAKDAPAADRQKAKARAVELLAAVRAAPESFAQVAAKNSQDTGSAAKSGDLGFFARGLMVKPFEDAVFAMQPGDISDVVESDFGYHIIRLTDIKKPVRRSLDDLRAQLTADLKTQQAQRKFAEVAELFTNTVYEQSDSLRPAADRLGLEVKTASVTRQPAAGVTGILANDKFLTALFSEDAIDKKRNTPAIETAPNQLAAGRVVSHRPAHALPLDQVSDTVRSRVVRAHALALAKKDGAAQLAVWTANPAAARLDAPVVVARSQSKNLPAPVIAAALRADTKALPTWIGADLGQEGYAVVRVNKIAPPTTTTPDRDVYARAWGTAESLAYYDVLKDRWKARILVTHTAGTLPSSP